MSAFVSRLSRRNGARVPHGPSNYVFYRSFLPIRYQFMWSLTPSATTLDFQNLTVVLKHRENSYDSSVNVTFGPTSHIHFALVVIDLQVVLEKN